MMIATDIVKELPKGLIKWYGFEKNSKALYIARHTELDYSLAETLKECGLKVKCFSSEEIFEQKLEKYRYIVVSSVTEQTRIKIVSLLKKIKTALDKNGKLFIVTENRMAIRYFCGDQDPYTSRNFDGVEGYRRVGDMNGRILEGRLYSKAELVDILETAGFSHYKFYSVFPEIMNPQILFAENYIPNEELDIRIFPQYHNPDTVFLEEEYLYTSLIQNGLFHIMANGFLIECSLGGDLSLADQVTLSMERGKENALCTIVRHDGLVEKKPMYGEGKKKAEKIYGNSLYLEEHGIRMAGSELIKEVLVMPYVHGVSLVRYFRTLIKEDLELFYCQFDRLWNMILHSSEHVPYHEIDWQHFNPWWDDENERKKQKRIDREQWEKIAFGTEGQEELGVILQRGYIDLVLLNGIWTEQEYVFFDQELYVENLPAKAIMLRNINLLYHGDAEIEQALPREILLKRYKCEKCKEIFYAYIKYYLTRLRNDDVLSDYHRMRRRKKKTVHSNRQRMNYSAEEYQRLFVDIFKNIENKKLYLFGAGKFTKKFLALYKNDYDVIGIVDNDERRWGDVLDGIKIMPPSVLKSQDASTYKVIICIKNYVGVLRQTKELGATNIGIYDTNIKYQRKQPVAAIQAISDSKEKKKYHIGYVAGVFDLFHVGHLNLLRRAKEQCDYLIVGVVTDDGVRRNKHTESFIPFEERLDIVQACKYVDEAVGIPLEFCDTKDAYLKFQFDVQFSGSDYAEDPSWLKKREFLRSHGAELIFFPYTESTNSTMIKKMIIEKAY